MMHWNPPRWVPLTIIFFKVFFRLTTFFFRNKKIFSKEQLLFSFLCIKKQKKIWSDPKICEHFHFWKNADSGTPRYVLWCCGGICHQPNTFIKIGSGHTVCSEYHFQLYYCSSPFHLIFFSVGTKMNLEYKCKLFFRE